jgi:hypothetical protein
MLFVSDLKDRNSIGFPTKIAEQALVDCGRHCCVCHKFCGSKIELHHIEQRADAGEDSFDNCIPLCFDCHADVKSYNVRHPKGRKYSTDELSAHRDKWYAKVRNAPVLQTKTPYRELDKALFIEIMEQLRESIMKIVCKHDYASAFYQDWHQGIYDFISCSDLPEKEFLDPDLEGDRAKLRDVIRQFLNSVAQHTFLIRTDGGGSLYRANRDPAENTHLLIGLRKRAKDEAEFEHLVLEQRRRNQEIHEHLNAQAEKLCNAYQDFIRSGRRRLMV